MERFWIRKASWTGAWHAGGTTAVGLAALLALEGQPVQARPAPRFIAPALAAGPELDAPVAAEPSSAASRLITTSAIETTWFGGTVWAADSNRYEAIPGGTWTFDSGMGSSMVPPGDPCKPTGYHRTFEGWTELNFTRQSPDNVWRRMTTCAIQGSRSMWLGKTAAEAQARCYAAGAGYGTNWDQYVGKTFQYPGSGAVTLSFDYAVDAEPNFDYLFVEVDRTGSATSSGSFVEVARYTGATSGHAVLTLTPGVSLPTQPGPVRFYFRGYSDGGYDDQDGHYATTCGLAAVDNIVISGAISDAANFESSEQGWTPTLFCGPGREWADLADAATLTMAACTTNSGACALSDSVLLFRDQGVNQFTEAVDEVALSPWIDLRRAGITRIAGCFIKYDGYFFLPGVGHTYLRFAVEWSPGGCGVVGTGTGFQTVQAPICASEGRSFGIDLSSIVPPGAERIRVGVGLYSDCWQYLSCDAPPYEAAWFDNIRVGVLDRSAPAISVPFSPAGAAGDAFASDGTLNPASTARVDAWGDTLVCAVGGANVETRINFRVRPGPFTNAAALNAWATSKWTPAPLLGSGWWSARMDTAESQSQGVISAGRWMTALHESDPHFGGGTDTDRGGDVDARELSHDIFPDHLLTPGARLDYFFSARYLPPDPRNPAGDTWSLWPDTTGGRYLEMEVLPGAMTADTTWNCVLYVNGHTDPTLAAAEQGGLRQALGPGVLNAEGTRFDRWDGLPLTRATSAGRGASAVQLAAYRTIVWCAGWNGYYSILNGDAAALNSWLTAATPAQPRALWATGSFLAYGLSNGTTAQKALLSDRFGAQPPVPAAWFGFSGGCLPLAGVGGAHFTVPGGAQVSPQALTCNGGTLDAIAVTAAASATARAQATTLSGKALSITNDVAASGRRTILDSFPLGMLRDSATGCVSTAAVTNRVVAALGWFGLPNGGYCASGGVSDAGPPGTPPPATHLELEPVPRPSAGERWHFAVALPAAAPLTLRLFDVTGREVRTLMEAAPLAAGRHEIDWDGRTTSGEPAASGLYFLRASAAGEVRTRKLVLTR